MKADYRSVPADGVGTSSSCRCSLVMGVPPSMPHTLIGPGLAVT